MTSRITRIAPALMAILAVQPAVAQFSSTSDGSDGALVLNRPDPDPNPNQPFVIEFDPDDFDPPLDPDRDNIYHFTTVTIGADVTVKLSDAKLNGPVYWLAQGNVVINGIIDLNGGNGDTSIGDPNTAHRLPAVAGAGGFGGGVGGSRGSVPSAGLGPGGGRAPDDRGGGAGHATGGRGILGFCGGERVPGAGAEYGNAFLVPLIGGSGGSGGTGGTARIGGSGGAGGGAMLIASDTRITVAGRISADGGTGGSGGYGGGGGSGGGIRLAAPTVAGAGTITARGGLQGDGLGADGSDRGCRDDGSAGAAGRIRIEAFDIQYTGPTDPVAPRSGPVDVFLPPVAARALASLRVVSVNGTPVVNPSASLTLADVITETRAPIEVAIEARNIPLGTIVNLRVVSENATDQVLDSTPLAGTQALSTATVNVPALPPGFSRAFARAEWSE